MNSVANNKFLLVNPGVILTPSIEPVILMMEPVFASAGLVAYVTSGYRTEQDQLDTIRMYLMRKELDRKHPAAMTCGLYDKEKATGNYVWQMAWSNLLAIGIIINPPVPARCLMDTKFDNRNRKGKLIPGSSHTRKKAMDIGGSKNGINDEVVVVKQCIEMKIEGLVSYRAEHDNNAVHCECKLIAA